MAIVLLLEAAPRTTEILLFGSASHFASKAMTAWLAAPSTGGAAT